MPRHLGQGPAFEREQGLSPSDGRALVDVIRDPFVATNRERRIALWNTAAQTTYGFSRAEALGSRASQLLQTRFPIPLSEIERLVQDTGIWSGNLVHRAKDGRELRVETRWVVRYDDGGHPSGLIAVDRDVTGRQEGAALLASGAAHDFNNMLGVINTFAAHLAVEVRSLERAPDGPGSRSLLESIGQIEDATDRATRLARTLVAFGREEIARPVRIDLNDLVSGVEELLRGIVGHRVELSTALAAAPCTVDVDPGQLEQVLINVVINGRDAMPEGGTIRIDTAHVDVATGHAGLVAGTYVRLRVRDTGPDTAADVLARAFDPFFTTKAVGRGTGLGLTRVRGIIAGLGGRATLLAEPGRGTTFSALIPAAAAASLPAAA